MLSLVPRHQLGNIVPKIGDRKFAAIVQPFLHEYKEITIVEIEIVAPYKEDPDDPHPRVRVWQRQNHRHLRIKMAEAQMPTNIKTMHLLHLRFATHIFPLYIKCLILENLIRLSHSVISTSLCSILCKNSSRMACWTMCNCSLITYQSRTFSQFCAIFCL
jgi:hypothetical protein